jgi:hypothetical protein
MNVIPPATIADAQLTSSTVPEAVAATYNSETEYALGARVGLAPVNGQPQTVWESLQNVNTGNALEEGAWWTNVGIVYPAWSDAVTYAADDIVSVLATHKLYKSIAGSNLNNPVTDESKWEYLGYTNRWRMFDYTRSQPTERPGEIEVVVAPGVRFDAVALTGLIGDEYLMTVTSTAGGGTIFTETGSLLDRQPLGWSDYFFSQRSYRETLVMTEIPPYSDSVITLTITGTTAGCSAMVMGREFNLGATQYNAVSDALNFSSVSRDDDGNAVLTSRRNIPQTTQTVWMDKSRVNRSRKLRDDLNALPAFWYAVPDSDDGYFESLAILGVYKEFSLNVAYPEIAVLNIKIERI